MNRFRICVGVAAWLSFSLWSAIGGAQTAHFHDGLYLRLGAGIGYVGDSAESAPLLNSNVKATFSGGAVVGQVGVGGTVSKGLVIGGRWLAELLPGPTASGITWYNTSSEDVDFDASTFHLLAPFIDWYFDPHKGLHLEGSAGYAILAVGDGKGARTGGAVQSQTATGFGLSAGIGYEWWIADDWGVGIMGEICTAWVSGRSDIGFAQNVDWNHFVYAPSLSFTATMN